MNILLNVIPFILFILLVITWVPWRDIFEKLYGNNPLRAKVYVEAGEQIKICNGKYYSDAAKGVLYKYKYHGVKSMVLVPSDYPFRFVLGRRQVRVLAGQGIASPLGGMNTGKVPIGANQLDEIIEAHIGTELARTIFGKAMPIMQIIVILGVVAVAGFFLYNQMQPGGMFNKQPIEQPAPGQPEHKIIIPEAGPLE